MLTAASARHAQLEGGTLRLRDHQLAMLQRCVDVESHWPQGIGILKDKVGSGKTHVILALIMQGRPGPTLVVVPQTVHAQWLHSIEMINDGNPAPLSCLVCVTYEFLHKLQYGAAGRAIGLPDVVLTTPVFFDVITAAFASTGVRPRRVVFDEVDSIDWGIRSVLPAAFTWFVSATFQRVPDAYKETSFSDSACSVWCEEAFVAASWPLPDPVSRAVACAAPLTDKVLMRLPLTPAQRRRVNDLDYRALGVAADDDVEAVLALETRTAAKLREIDDVLPGQKKQVKFQVGAKRKAMEEAIEAAERERAELQQVADALAEGKEALQEGEAVQASGKPAALLDLLRDEEKLAVLVYAEWGLGAVKTALAAAGIEYSEVRAGTLDEVQQSVGKYQAGDTRVLLADASLFRAGMNLEMTTDLLFLSPMLAEQAKQAIGRCQRPGRVCPLAVWTLTHANEVALA